MPALRGIRYKVASSGHKSIQRRQGYAEREHWHPREATVRMQQTLELLILQGWEYARIQYTPFSNNRLRNQHSVYTVSIRLL
nr:hypothetical protein [Candidatus Freyarchaeota archaeon]